MFPDRSRQDIYFTHGNLALIEQFCDCKLTHSSLEQSFEQDQSIDKLFGIAFNPKTLEMIKIKRYYYPRDPKLLNSVHDELK